MYFLALARRTVCLCVCVLYLCQLFLYTIYASVSLFCVGVSRLVTVQYCVCILCLRSQCPWVETKLAGMGLHRVAPQIVHVQAQKKQKTNTNNNVVNVQAQLSYHTISLPCC